MKDNSNISQEFLETVERYYNGTMANDECIEFDKKLHQDATFKSQVEDIQSLLFGIESQSLKEKLDEFHKELPIQMETKKSTTKVRFVHFRKIAAAAIIIIASGSFWFFNSSSNERLYDNHFSPDPGLPTTMSNSDNFKFYDAMVNYKQGHYGKAIAKWEVLEQKSPENDTINYFIGVAYLANKNTNKAIPYLNKTINSSNSVFIDDAHYYLGLVYLKNGNTEQAKKNFKLSSVDKAKSLLSKLKD